MKFKLVNSIFITLTTVVLSSQKASAIDVKPIAESLVNQLGSQLINKLLGSQGSPNSTSPFQIPGNSYPTNPDYSNPYPASPMPNNYPPSYPPTQYSPSPTMPMPNNYPSMGGLPSMPMPNNYPPMGGLPSMPMPNNYPPMGGLPSMPMPNNYPSMGASPSMPFIYNPVIIVPQSPPIFNNYSK